MRSMCYTLWNDRVVWLKYLRIRRHLRWDYAINSSSRGIWIIIVEHSSDKIDRVIELIPEAEGKKILYFDLKIQSLGSYRNGCGRISLQAYGVLIFRSRNFVQYFYCRKLSANCALTPTIYGHVCVRVRMRSAVGRGHGECVQKRAYLFRIDRVKFRHYVFFFVFFLLLFSRTDSEVISNFGISVLIVENHLLCENHIIDQQQRNNESQN